MSAVDRLRASVPRSVRRRWRGLSVRFARFAVGDGVGLALFLGGVCFAGLYWRIGFFITDNVTLANALVALSEGSLRIEEARYGSLASPGMHRVDGGLYARNYGQIAAALPVLWALRGLAAVVDVGVLLSALWSLAFLGLSVQVGRLLDRPRVLAAGGSLVAGGWFLLNLSVGRPVEPRQFPLIALDVSALLAASLAAVLLYRLLARIYDTRVGVAAAALSIAATPLGFWATIPKRHVFTVATAAGVMYALYRSRDPTPAEAPLSATGFRALAYAQVGLFAWVHAPEAFVLFLALAAVDLPTAPSNDRRSLALVAAAFLVSLLPFFVTNTLISGNPIRVPRMLPSYGGGELDLVSDGGSGGTSGAGLPLPPFVAGPLDDVARMSTIVLDLFVGGAVDIARRPGGLSRVFVRGGPIDTWLVESQSINLTALESAPILAGVGAAVGSLARTGYRSLSGGPDDASRERGTALRFPAGRWLRRGRALVADSDPRHAVDGFGLVVALGFVLIYVPLLPVHAQVTVRYLLVVFPLGVYAMARHGGLRRVLSGHGRLALGAWSVGVCIGVQILLLAVVALEFGRGEAFQLHALLGLGLAAALAVAAASSAVTDRFDRPTAVLAGLAAALGTDLLLLSGFVYFQYGQYALPAVESLSRLLSVV